MRLLYGTENPAKIKHMKEMLNGLDIEIIGLKDVELFIEPIDESGNSPLENAKIKAKAYYEVYRMPVFSCDSGLFIEGVEEFIRRFLMHILPSRFVKIRHYGILSNRNRNLKLKKCKNIIGVVLNPGKVSIAKLSAAELLLKLTGIDIKKCPCCKEGKMVGKDGFIPRNCSPPREIEKTA